MPALPRAAEGRNLRRCRWQGLDDAHLPRAWRDHHVRVARCRALRVAALDARHADGAKVARVSHRGRLLHELRSVQASSAPWHARGDRGHAPLQREVPRMLHERGLPERRYHLRRDRGTHHDARREGRPRDGLADHRRRADGAQRSARDRHVRPPSRLHRHRNQHERHRHRSLQGLPAEARRCGHHGHLPFL